MNASKLHRSDNANNESLMASSAHSMIFIYSAEHTPGAFLKTLSTKLGTFDCRLDRLNIQTLQEATIFTTAKRLEYE